MSMSWLKAEENGFVWNRNHETLRVQAWGTDSVRVRITCEPDFTDSVQALIAPRACPVTVTVGETEAKLVNGRLTVKVSDRGVIRFFMDEAAEPVLEEAMFPEDVVVPIRRRFVAKEGGLYRIEQRFKAYPGERLYGLGQHTDVGLNLKGSVIDLDQRNTQVCIPFLLSSRGYGLLWNMPSVGQVELSENRTRWVAESAREIDYWFTVGPAPADILAHYADATGHAPMLPEFAAGFWQCKLRYRTQEELLTVAREHKRRGLPLSVIVADFFHWAMMGDWSFDPKCWPDPAAMVKELREMGVELMVSVWPSINPDHPEFNTLTQKGFLVRTDRGLPAETCFMDTYNPGKVYIHFYDPTHPEARAHLWSKLRENYYKLGIRVFWLDACEPELPHRDYDLLRYHLGNGETVTNLYPFLHEQGVYEGLKQEGEKEIITLCRSAWAGSQRFGVALWSGDIASTFPSLQRQLRAGLNVGLSGLPWWNTDIGGFTGGKAEDPSFRELLVRWFQYGAFCPLFRLHGMRMPYGDKTGAPNEVWSYGDEVYGILRDYLFLRERLRPYIMEQMEKAHKKGLPPMRPLFVDFTDPVCADVDDQYLFGPDLLVAPVVEEGVRQRKVYLPAGTTWRNAWTDETHAGGQWIEVAAPLEQIPLFLRGKTKLPIRAP
jgi:alpha-D-xyloside xylohydrolase